MKGNKGNRINSWNRGKKNVYSIKSIELMRKAKIGKRWKSYNLPELTEAEKGYIAGLIDGEGSILLKGNQYTPAPYLQIVNTNKKCLEYIQKALKAGTVTVRKGNGKENWKKCYIWRAHTNLQALKILEAILPFLIIKKELAIKMIRIIRAKQEN